MCAARGAALRGARARFSDVAVVVARGGRGGRGAGGFEYARAGARFGRPMGGSGGRGGDVVLVPRADVLSLQHLLGRGGLTAGAGGAGGADGCGGARGRDLEVPVPLGCAVADVGFAPGGAEGTGGVRLDAPTVPGEAPIASADDGVSGDGGGRQGRPARARPAAAGVGPDGPLRCADIVERMVVAAGGYGGRGNAAMGLDNAQREAGAAGAVRRVRLELRTIADVGLVGAPSAGKSSLLAAVSGARPAVADYAFTTLRPNVGVALAGSVRAFCVADIPGLVAGAHAGRGLGHAFLRHVVRAPTLALVVDVSAPDAPHAAAAVLAELEHHTPGLARRVCAVVANKADVFGDDGARLAAAVDALRGAAASFWRARFGAECAAPVLPVSARHAAEVHRVVALLADAVSRRRAGASAPQPQPGDL